jgi:hypothetical protein
LWLYSVPGTFQGVVAQAGEDYLHVDPLWMHQRELEVGIQPVSLVALC